MSDQSDEPERRVITLKELDHIQAILSRFDTFFFLMKQVCLASMAAVFATSVANKLRIIPWFIVVIPFVFLAIESNFRFFYWVRYITRVEEIRRYLNGETNLPRLYVIKSPRNEATWCRAIKRFDLIYYGTWAVVAFFAELILAMEKLK